MKMIAGFVIGVVVCILAMWAISGKTQAAGDSTTLPDGTDASALLPNITAIYQQALALPYQQVEPEITDPSIAAFFAKYMAETGLDQIPAN
jgi:anaerobic glycerol-3-phosphate dehydrogenase